MRYNSDSIGYFMQSWTTNGLIFFDSTDFSVHPIKCSWQEHQELVASMSTLQTTQYQWKAFLKLMSIHFTVFACKWNERASILKVLYLLSKEYKWHLQQRSSQIYKNNKETELQFLSHIFAAKCMPIAVSAFNVLQQFKYFHLFTHAKNTSH